MVFCLGFVCLGLFVWVFWWFGVGFSFSESLSVTQANKTSFELNVKNCSCKFSVALLHGNSTLWLLPSVMYALYIGDSHNFFKLFSHRTSVRATNCICMQRNLTGTVLLQVYHKVVCSMYKTYIKNMVSEGAAVPSLAFVSIGNP